MAPFVLSMEGRGEQRGDTRSQEHLSVGSYNTEHMKP